MHTFSAEKTATLISGLKNYYLLSIVAAMLLSVIISHFISRHIVSHLEELNYYISELTKNNFKFKGKLNLRHSSTEIRMIYQEFRNMVAQLFIWEKQRDKAIRIASENENKYRELSDLLPQSVYETDELGNFTYVNKAWFKNFRFSQEDIAQGLNLIETLMSEKGNNELLGNVKIENSDYVATRKDGTKFPASVFSDKIIKKGKVVGHRGVIVNVTRRNQFISMLINEKNKAKVSDKHKSSFLASMSHEIRTPMNSIIGFSNLLIDENLDEGQKKMFARYIKSSGEMLLNLIDDILDIAKIEAGELKIKQKECNVYDIVSEVFTSFMDIKNRTGKTHIKLELDLPENKNVVVKTDPFRLKQVISNIVGNAIKFTDEGFVKLGYQINKAQHVQFYVRDTGPGLSDTDQKIIFSQYKRTENSEDRNISGTGLGLNISKNLIDLLGGKMWVESVLEEGTVFKFTLPYFKIELPKTQQKTIISEENGFNWIGKTILVSEDDDSSFHFIKELLNRTQAEIIRAEDGKKCTDLIQQGKHVDLILMDIHMPIIDGYMATRKIKRINKNIPIIAQTAYAMEGDKEKSVTAGCDDYITKPLTPEKLLNKINKYLGKDANTAKRNNVTDNKNLLP